MKYYIIYEENKAGVIYDTPFQSVQQAQSWASVNLRGVRYSIVDENQLRQLQQRFRLQQGQQSQPTQTQRPRNPMFFDLSGNRR